MNVSVASFPSEAVKILQEIGGAHFVALDFEFSGVAGRGSGGKPSVQGLYHEVKAAAERYQVLQVGLTIVKEDLKTGVYVVRPYNFSLSPIPAVDQWTLDRSWGSSSGAMSFLSSNNFSFDDAIKNGVKYLSRKEEMIARNSLIQQSSKSNISDIPITAKHAVLVTHIRQSVQAWLEIPPARRDGYLNIPGIAPGVPATLNREQVRLTHQVVRGEFSGLHTQGMGHFVRITAPTEEQQSSAALTAIKNREKLLADAVGLRWVIEGLVGGNIGGMPDEYVTAGLPYFDLKGQTPKAALAKLQEKLRKRKRVIVGHNCFTDLVYFYKCFIGDLPESLEEFNEAISELFPLVVDTKHMAEFGQEFTVNGRKDTRLAVVSHGVRCEDYPLVKIPSEHSAYESATSYHEAGFDSFLTAKVAILLSGKMERQGKYKEYIEAPGYESMLPAFNVDDDGYITATSSAYHSRASSIHEVDTLSEEVQTPTTANITSFDSSSQATARSTGRDSSATTVVAIKDSIGQWIEKSEVEKVKHRMTSTNIYSALEGDDSKMPSRDEDLMSFSSDSEDETLPPKRIDMYEKIKKGELMPRWESELWTTFGNILQANSSRDGMNKLK